MSGTFPITTFAGVMVKSNTPSYSSIAISGKRQIKQIATQYWSFEAKTTPLSARDVRRVEAFFGSQYNNYYDWDIFFPQLSYSIGDGVIAASRYPAVDSTMTVSSSFGSGSPVVNVRVNYTATHMSGLTWSKFMAAGDFIRFSNHTKVYQLTSDVQFQDGADIILPIYPALITPVTNTTTVDWKYAAFRVFLTSSSLDVEHGIDSSTMSMMLQESL